MGLERKTQLYFGEDRTFEFIKRPLKYSCLVQMEGDQMKRAWPHYYNAEIPFDGYHGISAGTVTLGFPRDIILDPFNKIPRGTDTNKKPNADTLSVKTWIKNKAETMRHIYRSKRTTSYRISWLEITLLAIIGIEAIGWLIRFATG